MFSISSHLSNTWWTLIRALCPSLRTHSSSWQGSCCRNFLTSAKFILIGVSNKPWWDMYVDGSNSGTGTGVELLKLHPLFATNSCLSDLLCSGVVCEYGITKSPHANTVLSSTYRNTVSGISSDAFQNYQGSAQCPGKFLGLHSVTYTNKSQLFSHDACS